MDELKQFSVWSVVKFDLIGKEFEAEFMAHFDDHIQELVEREGFVRAWRTREARRSYNSGMLEQEFCQIYQIDDPLRFVSSPRNGMPPATEKEPWRRDLSGWGRVFYRIRTRREKDARAGRYWGRYDIDYRGRQAGVPAFRRALAAWVNRVVDLPGVHRGWLLEYLPHASQVDKDPAARHLVVFEIDAPENIFDPSLDADRIAWKDRAAPVTGRHFSRLLKSVVDFPQRGGKSVSKK